MLTHLHIRNFALIDALDIDFRPGFSVITGETGAGKSIILGAIGLLMGQRADAKTMKQGAERCVIEAHFNLERYSMEGFFADNDIDYDPYDCIVRRELAASGKSRAFINDTPAPLALLKELGESLIDIHSQHQNLLLNKHDFQLNVLDIIAGDGKELSDYRHVFAQYQQAQRDLESLREQTERQRDNADFIRFQHEELLAAQLTDGEQEELERRADAMSHSEDIKSALFTADNALAAEATGIVESLRTAASALAGVAPLLPKAAEAARRMDSAYIELKDISQDISALLGDVDFNPAELDSVNARLDKIYELEKKHRCDTIAELIDIRETLARQLDAIDNGDESLAEMETRVAELKGLCHEKAARLTALRSKAAAEVEREMCRLLAPLAMPNVRFAVSMEPAEIGRDGADRVAFLFSANRSTEPQPVSGVASGGEIARVMLALKAMISGAVKLPTIIFDEIDTGVSGKTAERMAQMMAEMGRADRQVISITHLPQIAAQGSTHYKVSKSETPSGTVSRMELLSRDGRIAEIAQMLSGSDITEAAISNAKELLRL